MHRHRLHRRTVQSICGVPRLSLTDDQWAKIHKKYKRLMYAVAHRIGGDKVAHDFDDSNQELALTAMDAVDAFSRKTGKDFDTFFNTIEFDKYIKTCLWNKKNNVGLKIKKKYEIRNCVSLSGNTDAFSTQEGSVYGSGSLEVEPEDVSYYEDVELDNDSREIVECVLGDMRLIKPDGNLNISKIARITQKQKAEVRTTIEKMKFQLKDYNETV